jgi:prepilin-type N-terminal cleavage/methylation domain-containing protein
MKHIRRSSGGLKRSRERAFTLVELLVASAVLALFLALLLQIVNSITTTTRAQNRQMESVGAARRALDVMASDIKNAVISENVSILVPSSDSDGYLFALLANRRPPASPSGVIKPNRFLSVCYRLSGDKLFRTYDGVDFSPNDLFAEISSVIAKSTTNTDPLVSNILSVQLVADIEGAGTLVLPPSGANAYPHWAANGDYNGFPMPRGYAIVTASHDFARDAGNKLSGTTRALEIWIAAADAKTYGILNVTGQLDDVKGLFANNLPSSWRSAVDGLSGLSPDAKSGIRILNIAAPLP